MPDLEEITVSIRSRLDEKERARETALQSTRQIIKSCRSAITKIQKREDPIGDISSAREVFVSLKEEIGKYYQVFEELFLSLEQVAVKRENETDS